MALGIVDYVQDKFEELRQEFMERGENKGEDLREFFDDVLENFSFLSRRDEDAEDGELATDPDEGRADGILGHYGLSETRESVKDLMDGVGLATPEDLRDLHEKLDRLQETIKNLMSS